MAPISLPSFGRTLTEAAPKPRADAELIVLLAPTSHAWEHYGNLVIYMRLKGIVPPSSERPST